MPDRQKDGRTEGRMDGQMDGRMEILPCVLQDIVPFGSTALLPIHMINKILEGARVPLTIAILGLLVVGSGDPQDGSGDPLAL